MADKFHSDTQEKIEILKYAPGLQDTGDLEAATNTITATSRPATGSADYSAALTLPAPTDARMTVQQIACRLNVMIDSMTAGNLYCSVRVDVDDTDHELFSENWTTNGEKLAAEETRANNLPDIFNLLKDGSSHTFYFLFWVDSGNAVVSLVQLWEALGSNDTSYGFPNVLGVDHTGTMTITAEQRLVGTGSSEARVKWKESDSANDVIGRVATVFPEPAFNALVATGIYFGMRATVATDLAYIQRVLVVLESDQ